MALYTSRVCLLLEYLYGPGHMMKLKKSPRRLCHRPKEWMEAFLCPGKWWDTEKPTISRCMTKYSKLTLKIPLTSSKANIKLNIKQNLGAIMGDKPWPACTLLKCLGRHRNHYHFWNHCFRENSPVSILHASMFLPKTALGLMGLICSNTETV